jgi:asparagine synthase (glutamine-hydrolysing)
MGKRLAHRGRDDAAVVRSPLGFMGIQRLAVIDLRDGTQPVRNEIGSIQAVLNGEVYNYRALRERLRALGHAFASRGDAETIVHAYEEYGLDCVLHFRGMFAFALFDASRGRVVLACDPMGKKPLYYALRGERLLYASELKALLCDPALPRAIDRRALRHYFTFKNVPSPLTIFEGICRLSPGTIAVYENGALTLRQYRRPLFVGDAVMSEGEAEERLTELLREAVRLRIEASDVPVGAFLSGGLDSSLIVALMAEHAGAPVKTFALGYTPRVGHKNDVDFAREVAERFGCEHHELTITGAIIADELACALETFDEPFGGAITSFWLSRFIASQVKVALSGDGADELFGSYAAHRHAATVRAFGAEVAFGAWRTRFCAFTDEFLDVIASAVRATCRR